jgi:hypothetical protein
MGTVRAAEEIAPCFNAMTDNITAAMLACGGKCVYGAFEAVEIARDTVYENFQGFVVFIAANFASVHIFSFIQSRFSRLRLSCSARKA